MSMKISDAALKAIADVMGIEREGESAFIKIDEITFTYSESSEEIIIEFLRNGKEIAMLRNMLPRGDSLHLHGVNCKIPMALN